MSLLPSRPVAFGRPTGTNTYLQQQQQLQAQQQAQQQQQQSQATATSLSLPSGPNIALPRPSNLALPGYAQPVHSQMPPPPFPLKSQYQTNGNAVAGPSSVSPPPSAVPSTPAPLTLEQQHITAVDGIVPTLQNIVATVNLDCRLDLKTIALHARNAEYNPKVSTFF